jgi:hypothetical protein
MKDGDTDMISRKVVVMGENGCDTGYCRVTVQSEDGKALSAQDVLDAVADYLLYECELEIKKQRISDRCF